MGILAHFRDILVILEVSRYFLLFGVYFSYFGGSKGFFYILFSGFRGILELRNFVKWYLGLIVYLVKTQLILMLIEFNWVNTHLTQLIITRVWILF